MCAQGHSSHETIAKGVRVLSSFGMGVLGYPLVAGGDVVVARPQPVQVEPEQEIVAHVGEPVVK